MTKLVADTLSTALRRLGWVTEIHGADPRPGLGADRFEVRVTGKTAGGARVPA